MTTLQRREARPKIFVVQGVRYRRPPPPWLVLSIGAHLVLILALGFIRVFHGGGDGWFGGGGPPPLRRVTLLGPVKPRIDLDARTGPEVESSRIIDPWASASLSDHDESPDDEAFAAVKGDTLWVEGKLLAELGHGGKGHGVGVQSTGIGVGVGAGHPRPGQGAGQGGGLRRGDRIGGRRNLALRGGGSDATERAVAAGLRWLARHQSPDGSWSSTVNSVCHGSPSCSRGTPEEDERHEVGLTGLALLALLDAGYAPGSPERYLDEVTGKAVSPGNAILRGLRWLEANMDEDGSFRSHGGCIYDDAIATFALADASGRTDALAVRKAARRAVQFLLASQNRGAGWRYDRGMGDTDTSVTAWCVLALRSARNAGFEVPDDAFEGARDFVVGATERNGLTGYLSAGDAGNEDCFGEVPRGTPRLGNTPAGMLCRLLADGATHGASYDRSERLVLANPPRWDYLARAVKWKTNFTYWYYGTLALFVGDGPSGEKWRSWNETIVTSLVGHQQGPERGCAGGSWDAENDWWASREGGRVFATAINVLTLEVYYRYAPIVTPTWR